MKKITSFRHKKVLVLGLARSGVKAAELLHELGAFVTVNDKKSFDENPAAQGLLEEGITVITGSHPTEMLDEGFELVVKNPGIPYENQMIQKALTLNIPIITEVELAYLISEAQIVGVTGTNGKTTTTTLINEMLNRSKTALLAGNIGFPASGVAMEAKAEDIITMELSSFQLMGIETFRPHIAVIVNIYEAHLDYHGSRQGYVAAKLRIFENQQADDFLVVNWNQPELRELVTAAKSRIVPFSTKEVVEAGAYVLDGNLMFKGEIIGRQADIVLPGEHNLENVLAAICVAKLEGESNENIMAVLSSFNGVEHRTQFIKTLAGRRFYNDSKATNIISTESALKGFKEPVVLLAGGLDRGNEFDDLKPFFKNVRAVVLFGETKHKIARVATEAGVEHIKIVTDVEEAVPVAYTCSEPGDVILLSPACASWDQVPSFEVRGDLFIKAVNAL
ncbi:UDP-N-acetylmuramoyl-L-alanine--D-glutamate ligase [Brochothrix campestris]|uniref:UDP-N-acetylmuramoylalanine--D-glutamate ligase n=1 Tax=Brochothrix campestris FSL F6-1037 TaxID=1265861 RepID=W7CXM7_9LIST|nr:UDP-N-acetylmuramoyl-L-alanine--D-glutamate ligase [Brochothrix campestris]EUJ41737.1 UDP-N-acetylmuramoyl-L-alanyl-D-glutamate synthetase [Brochothrix campestris FSL F6-1037]